jgi:hypothetical protein
MEIFLTYFKVVSWSVLVDAKVSVTRAGDPSYASNDLVIVLSCETAVEAECA